MKKIRFQQMLTFLGVWCCAALLGGTLPVTAQKRPAPVPLLHAVQGKPVYEKDSLGNRIPDYSYSGYRLSEVPIPTVENKIVVGTMDGDATNRIQAAIDYVAGLSPDASGFRGAVLLEPGTFRVSRPLRIDASGGVPCCWNRERSG